MTALRHKILMITGRRDLTFHHQIYTAMDTRRLLETYSKAHPRGKGS
jgi:hypothetical protein